jgi:hypothetical protein
MNKIELANKLGVEAGIDLLLQVADIPVELENYSDRKDRLVLIAVITSMMGAQSLRELEIVLDYKQLDKAVKDPDVLEFFNRKIVQGTDGRSSFQDPALDPLAEFLDKSLDRLYEIAEQNPEDRLVAQFPRILELVEARKELATGQQELDDLVKSNAEKEQELEKMEDQFKSLTKAERDRLRQRFLQLMIWIVPFIFLLSCFFYLLADGSTFSDRCLRQSWCRGLPFDFGKNK